ncbi:MAG: hypothetical protein HOP13_13865 [Alphaproteobacteria bacterium]|nr:hypothetical protein [Alphaproteobacteria bacterium]
MTKPAGISAIELSLREVGQIFETLDPYPFLERDLDKDAEEFIVGWARELPRDHTLRIVVHLPAAEAQSRAAADLEGGMTRFFRHRAEAIGRDLRELFRIGRMSLLIGVAVLLVCVAAAQEVEFIAGDGPLASVVGESLIILGWVANWRPLEIFLYEWWPIARRRNLYRRLSTAKVEVKQN